MWFENLAFYLKDALRKKIQESVVNPSSTIWVDNLYAFLHLAKTDEDLSVLKQAIQKNNTQKLKPGVKQRNFQVPFT